jgi:hypothetical protein
MDKENVAYIHNGLLFSHKDEIRLFAGKWVKPEIIRLNGISQVQKYKYCMFSLICEI